MKRITEANIKIMSVIENLDSSGLPIGDSERTESECSGFYTYSDSGELSLSYSETEDGAVTESCIIINEDSVAVKRTGAIKSELFFKEGETHMSVYSISPYSFDASVMTKKIRRSLDSSGGTLELLYVMRIGGADKSAKMKIWIYPCSNQI